MDTGFSAEVARLVLVSISLKIDCLRNLHAEFPKSGPAARVPSSRLNKTNAELRSAHQTPSIHGVAILFSVKIQPGEGCGKTKAGLDVFGND
jgi:hypothetical protein